MLRDQSPDPAQPARRHPRRQRRRITERSRDCAAAQPGPVNCRPLGSRLAREATTTWPARSRALRSALTVDPPSSSAARHGLGPAASPPAPALNTTPTYHVWPEHPVQPHQNGPSPPPRRGSSPLRGRASIAEVSQMLSTAGQERMTWPPENASAPIMMSGSAPSVLGRAWCRLCSPGHQGVYRAASPPGPGTVCRPALFLGGSAPDALRHGLEGVGQAVRADGATTTDRLRRQDASSAVGSRRLSSLTCFAGGRGVESFTDSAFRHESRGCGAARL
jgi:hypothetical protein